MLSCDRTGFRAVFIAAAHLLLAAGLAGCVHQPQEGQVDLLRIDHQDPQTRTTESYTGYVDPEGRLVKHGLSVDRYPSGAKYVESHYTHGRLDGEFRVFTEEGQTALVGTYKDGKPWEGLFQCGDHIKKYETGKFRGYVTDLVDPRAANSIPTH